MKETKELSRIYGLARGVNRKVNSDATNLNCIGYPHDEPYGLSAAFWKIFTKPKVEKKKEQPKKISSKVKKQSAKDFY